MSILAAGPALSLHISSNMATAGSGPSALKSADSNAGQAFFADKLVFRDFFGRRPGPIGLLRSKPSTGQ
jgi:hypothetical protein